MKTICVLILLSALAYGQQSTPNLQAESSGTCSPNILSNQGRVEFTCNTAMDKTTVTKIVGLLNQILQKEDTGKDDVGINRKLDDILAFLRSEAAAREPRHLEAAQAQRLVLAISGTPNQVVNILRTNRGAELDTFADELVKALKKGGWKIGKDEYALVGFAKATGLGVVVHSQQEHPPAADNLARALMNEGFKVEADANEQVEKNEIRLAVGPKQ